LGCDVLAIVQEERGIIRPRKYWETWAGCKCFRASHLCARTRVSQARSPPQILNPTISHPKTSNFPRLTFLFLMAAMVAKHTESRELSALLLPQHTFSLHRAVSGHPLIQLGSLKPLLGTQPCIMLASALEIRSERQPPASSAECGQLTILQRPPRGASVLGRFLGQHFAERRRIAEWAAAGDACKAPGLVLAARRCRLCLCAAPLLLGAPDRHALGKRSCVRCFHHPQVGAALEETDELRGRRHCRPNEPAA